VDRSTEAPATLAPFPPRFRDSTFPWTHGAAPVACPLPAHRSDGTLPPWSEGDGTCSPYFVTPSEIVSRFGTTPTRLELLGWLLDLRAALRRLGFDRGFQWIGGSFVRAGGAPRDIDVACFVHGTTPWSRELLTRFPRVFAKDAVKAAYGCDARYVDLRAKSY